MIRKAETVIRFNSLQGSKDLRVSLEQSVFHRTKSGARESHTAATYPGYMFLLRKKVCSQGFICKWWEGLRHADEDFISKRPGLIAKETCDFSRDSDISQLILNSRRKGLLHLIRGALLPFILVKTLTVHRVAPLTTVFFCLFVFNPLQVLSFCFPSLAQISLFRGSYRFYHFVQKMKRFMF